MSERNAGAEARLATISMLRYVAPLFKLHFVAMWLANALATENHRPRVCVCVCVFFLLKENVSSHSYPIQTVIGLMVDISLHGLAGLVGARSVSVA